MHLAQQSNDICQVAQPAMWKTLPRTAKHGKIDSMGPGMTSDASHRASYHVWSPKQSGNWSQIAAPTSNMPARLDLISPSSTGPSSSKCHPSPNNVADAHRLQVLDNPSRHPLHPSPSSHTDTPSFLDGKEWACLSPPEEPVCPYLMHLLAVNAVAFLAFTIDFPFYKFENRKLVNQRVLSCSPQRETALACFLRSSCRIGMSSATTWRGASSRC